MVSESSSAYDIETPLLPLRDTSVCSSSQFILRSPVAAGRFFRILSGPLTCVMVVSFVDLGGNRSGRNMLAVLAWVFSWWLTDALPMAVASMSPLFLFPLFGIASADDVARAYMNDIVSLLLGTFILAIAVEHYNIHRRLALNITCLFCGDPPNPQLLLLGICGTTAFVSMWVHNSAAAAMMLPVATGILQRFTDDGRPMSSEVRRYSKGVVLGVVFAAGVGGLSTVTGSGSNIIFVGMWRQYYPEEEPIGFNTWFLFGFPLALLLFFFLWAMLCFMYCSKHTGEALVAYLDRDHLKRELQSLGPMSFAEKMVLAIFGSLIFLWMTRSITDQVPGWAALFRCDVGDGTVSVLMATLLFVIPNRKSEGEMLMDWNKCRKLQWNIVLLVGAGFAIANGVEQSGLADVLAAGLGFLEVAPYLALAPMVALVSSSITEFTSDNSTTTLVLPLLVELARTIGVHPLLLMVPGTIGAQFSYLLPTSTPCNVMGVGTGHIDFFDMVRAGLPLKFTGVLVLTALMPTIGSYVFGTNKSIG